MDWTGEMTETFYLVSRTGSVSQGGSTVGFGGPAYGTQQGPFICKSKKVTKYVQDAHGTDIPVNTQMICYQPVSVTDKVWPPGTDQTQDDLARPVLSVSSESQVGEESTVLYLVGFQS